MNSHSALSTRDAKQDKTVDFDASNAYASQLGYQSNPLLASARRNKSTTKMLSNLPSGKYFELKDAQMMPNPTQLAV